MTFILIIIGVLILVWAAIKTKPYRKANSWCKTNGVILEIKEIIIQQPQVYAYIEFSCPQIKYQYTVSETIYQSESVSFEIENVTLYPESKNKPWIDWVKGEEISVFYNPINPNESVVIPILLPKRKSHYRALKLSGLICVLIGTYFAIYA